jgi:peptidyl-tRNA hydrolase
MKALKLLVRKNLKMSPNKLAAQCVHAALGLHRQDPQQHWKCIVLDASDKKFEEAKAGHSGAYVVRDAGYTEVPAGSETVMAWWEDDDDRQGGIS